MSLPNPLPEDDFHRRFFKLAAINILSNLMVPLAGLVDVAFLGHLSEIRHLAGVALATVLFDYIYWTFGFLRMGTTGTTAQAVGRNDDEAVLVTGLRNGAIALGLGFIILLLQYPLRELGFTLLSAATEVKASGIAYYNTLIWGAPATLINFVLIGWFLGQEQGGKVLFLSLVGNGANVVLDYIFIVRWGWESAGAGLATGISQYLMLVAGISLASAYFKHRKIKANSASQIFSYSALKETFALNRDIFIRTFALISTFAVFTNLSSSLGTVILTTNTLLLQVVTLSAYFIDGIAFATESFAGIFRGKGSSNQLPLLLKISGGVSISLGIIFAFVFALFPGFFLLLTNHQTIIVRINRYVWWLLPVLGFGAIAYMLDGYFIGLTEGKILKKSTLIAALVGFAPMAAIAWYFKSSQLLWLALSLFMLGRAITLAIDVPKTLRE